MTDLNPAVNITVNVGAGTYESIPGKGLASLQPQGSPQSHIPKPTVGRIVHFWHRLDEPWAAIVTRVVTDTEVHLAIFWPGVQDNSDLPLYDVAHPFSETPEPGHWSWPPRA